MFPQFNITKEFDVIDSEDYSLRNIAATDKTKLKFGKSFYLFVYLLPYEKDGNKYWCQVANSGKDIENWGKEFELKHYLVFEMIIE